jgi:hypothetical protein
VMFDPTPVAPGGELGRGGDGIRARMARLVDTLRFQWTKWVIEYDLVSQIALLKDIGGAVRDAAQSIQTTIRHVLAYWWVLAIAVAIAVGFVLARRRAGPALTAARRKRDAQARSRVARHYDTASRQLARAGHARAPAITPRVFATELAPSLATPMTELVELYYLAQWGGEITATSEARAEVLADEIRAALRTHQAQPR